MNDNKLIEEAYDKMHKVKKTLAESMNDWPMHSDPTDELRSKISGDIRSATAGVRRAIFNIMKVKDNSLRLRVYTLQKILDELEKFPLIK